MKTLVSVSSNLTPSCINASLILSYQTTLCSIIFYFIPCATNLRGRDFFLKIVLLTYALRFTVDYIVHIQSFSVCFSSVAYIDKQWFYPLMFSWCSYNTQWNKTYISWRSLIVVFETHGSHLMHAFLPLVFFTVILLQLPLSFRDNSIYLSLLFNSKIRVSPPFPLVCLYHDILSCLKYILF